MKNKHIQITDIGSLVQDRDSSIFNNVDNAVLH